MTVLVTGAGGFIGGHLVARLLGEGHAVRAVDAKPYHEWYQRHDGAKSVVADVSLRETCVDVVTGCDDVYNLAADMGGMGFIEVHRAECMLSVLINTHLLMAARDHGVQRYFFASSACVYPTTRQARSDCEPLRESDAYPAMAEDGYGWEKLFGERLCWHFLEDFGLETRVARYHNVYGPHGTFDGPRAKAPAALCRKVAQAFVAGTGAIEIWGDGEQSRTFLYVPDCIDGTRHLMDSKVATPINVGSAESVTINELVTLIEEIAGVQLKRTYVPDAPQGVRGRVSDNSLVRELLRWEPTVSLQEGIAQTYRWVYDQVRAAAR